MDPRTFGAGVWHPFGPHGGESPEQIIDRNQRAIAANGWTLWSFQYRRPEVLAAWCRELSDASPPVAFCSDSPGAVDPADAGESVAVTDCRLYRPVGEERWRPWPPAVRVSHPFRGTRRLASAFVVSDIIHPVSGFVPPAVEWFSNGAWQRGRVPPRGEYLVRPGGEVPMRPVRAILVLQAPYLALVSAEDAEGVKRSGVAIKGTQLESPSRAGELTRRKNKGRAGRVAES
jgi:hypothetical protein